MVTFPVGYSASNTILECKYDLLVHIVRAEETNELCSQFEVGVLLVNLFFH